MREIRESGILTCHLSSCHLFSALTENSSGMFVLLGTFMVYRVLLFDDVRSKKMVKCSRGTLQIPRTIYAYNFMAIDGFPDLVDQLFDLH